MRKLASLAFTVFLCLSASFLGAETPRADPEPFFSEYVEGAAARATGDRALEIFNPTDAPVDLSTLGYYIEIYADGAVTATYTIPLNGTIPPGGAFVLVASSANTTLQTLADQISASLIFDGNDLIVLGYTGAKKQSTTLLDAIGRLGDDPTPPGYWGTCPLCTADVDLRRDPSVLNGDISLSDAYDVASSWISYAADNFSDLGSHSTTPVELLSFSIE